MFIFDELYWDAHGMPGFIDISFSAGDVEWSCMLFADTGDLVSSDLLFCNANGMFGYRELVSNSPYREVM